MGHSTDVPINQRVDNKNPDAQLFRDGVHPDTEIARCKHSRDEQDSWMMSGVVVALFWTWSASNVGVAHLQLAMICCGGECEASMELVLSNVRCGARRRRVAGGR